MSQAPHAAPPMDLESIKARAYRPRRAVITGGMPYANGPLHLGHLAGALIPPDIFARYMRMLIGSENVLFVSGNDDHGSTSELSALKAGRPIREFIDEIHAKQLRTLTNYELSFDIFSGTSQPDCYEIHKKNCQDFIRKLHKNGMLEKRVSQQWYDPALKRFLQDRFVNGKCPNPKCENEAAYSDQCDVCGAIYEPQELLNPKSTLSDATPELKNTVHWWLDLWKVSEPLRIWIQSKEKAWRSSVYTEVLNTVLPSLSFPNSFEETYKNLKASLPKHKSKYAAGKKIQLQFENKNDLISAQAELEKAQITTSFVDGWAHRSISRDVPWGIPLPVDLDSEMQGKTFYVWPDSLVAPISFSEAALKAKGRSTSELHEFWKHPDSKIYQFLGQDNVYFYTLMQGALWIGSQEQIDRLPIAGEYQLNDVMGSHHLWVNGQRMSKSTGNYVTGDHLIDEKGYSADQVRYFLSTLTLSEKNSNFDFAVFEAKNKFLAGPMNASFEKPIAACHSKFESRVPQGKLDPKVEAETLKLLQKYLRSMERADYPVLLNLIENYARLINSLFTQFKPHDDRAPEEERRNSLYSCFYILKNLMIMLYPFVPTTMERLCKSLNLESTVFRVSEIGVPLAAGHRIGEKQEYFPPST